MAVSVTPFQGNSQCTFMSLYPSNVLKSQYEMWILSLSKKLSYNVILMSYNVKHTILIFDIIQCHPNVI